MRPHELAEPFFQYVCRLNRSARKGGIIDPDQTRNDLRTLLTDLNTKAQSDGQLAGQFDKTKGKLSLVLMFFADNIIRNSKLSFADDWQNLAAEEGEPNGDEKFFEYLEQTLRERADEGANERLAVYYICMGLGFTGSQAGRPQVLRQKMEECWSRLRGIWDAQPANRICPEAYENVNTTNLIEPPAASMVGIGIGLVGAIVVLFVANAFLYRSSSRELQSAVGSVLQHTPPAPAAKAPPAAAPAQR